MLFVVSLLSAALYVVSGSPLERRQTCSPSLGGKDVSIFANQGDIEWSYSRQDIGVQLSTAEKSVAIPDFRIETSGQGNAFWITASGDKSDFLQVAVNSTTNDLAFRFFDINDQSGIFAFECSSCAGSSGTLASNCSIKTQDKCVKLATSAAQQILFPSDCDNSVSETWDVRAP